MQQTRSGYYRAAQMYLHPPIHENGTPSVSERKVESLASKPNGLVPNSRFPTLVHRDGIAGGGVEKIKTYFRANGWLNNWNNPGVWDYGHFHSTTHECLGCASGWMQVRLFGAGGQEIRVEEGDVLVLPAGVSHEMLAKSDDNMMVGGYPEGRDWDNMRDEQIIEQQCREAWRRIMSLPIPAKDPVTGDAMAEWINAPSSGAWGFDKMRDWLDQLE